MTAGETTGIRRVVTGHDSAGKSVVLFDDVTNFPGRIQVWSTEGSPIDNSGSEDEALREPRLETPPQGSFFWVVRMPAGSGVGTKENEGRSESLAQQGATTRADARPGMHATRTLDYMIVLDGEITLILDDSETTLHKYDAVVQRGTAHHWENRTDHPALLAFVLLDAKELT